MLTQKKRLISCLLGFCFCLNLLFSAVAFAGPDYDFIGGDNYYGLIDEVRIFNKAIVLPASEPAPEEPDFVDGYIGDHNYTGLIDEVAFYKEAIALQWQEPDPVAAPQNSGAFICGDNYSGIIDDIRIYEASFGVTNHAPKITFIGLSEGQEINEAESTIDFGLLIEDEDIDFDHELETEIYIGVKDVYQKVTTFTINNRLHSKGEFTAENGTRYEISINKEAYVPKYVTQFTIKVIATDTLDEEGEEELTLIHASHLLAQWSLDSVRNRVAVDSSGLGNNGVIQGAALTTGIIGNAVALDGVDNYVEVPLTPSLALTTGSFSIEAWIKTSDESTVDKGVAGNYQTTTTPYWLLKQCGGTGVGKFGFSIRDTQENVVNIVSAKPLNDGIWHHLVGVRDTINKKVAFYVDGALVQEVTANIGDVNSEQNICLGAHLGSYFQGCLDEVTLYGCALTAADVLRNYQKVVFLNQLKMTNQHNNESTAPCTFGVHINKLEFELKKTVNRLALELDFPSSIKGKEILKISKDGVLIPNPVENPVVTFTSDGQLTFNQSLEAGHYVVEFMLEIDEHLIIRAKSFYDERNLKINCDQEIFWFKFMDYDGLPKVL